MRRRQTAAQLVWGVGDQAFSSLTNFALSIIVARNVSAEGFGAFTVGFATYTVVLTLSRAITSEPLTMRYSTAGRDDWRAGTAAATGAAFVVGVATGAVITVVGLLLDGPVGTVLVVLGLTLPGLLVQDAWRYAFFAAHRGGAAMANDVVWAVVMFGLLAAVLRDGLSVTTAMLVWTLGAVGAAVFGALQARTLPDPRKPLRWWREHWDLIPKLTAEAAVLSGVQPLTLFAVGGVAGLAAAGTVRAGQVLVNALNILTQGLRLSAIPIATRLASRSSRRVLEFCVAVAGGLAVIAVGWTTLLLLLPDRWGEAALGDSWAGGRTVLLPLGLAAAFNGIQAGGHIGLRAIAVTKRSLMARTTSASSVLVGGVAGALLGDAEGCAWGLALGALVGASAWWRQFLLGRREHDAADGVAQGAGGPGGPDAAGAGAPVDDPALAEAERLAQRAVDAEPFDPRAVADPADPVDGGGQTSSGSYSPRS